ncbi:hypothetical protein EYC80_003207 [Monilinia laxa]|uniref:Uncharacterized protein n=1 Tax=Monilinia laxa TaxID=61186 RepID=A0A5N6KD43_MONLA|nr:hypothetical protein EYC80_003207 [Monilinia laxa]
MQQILPLKGEEREKWVAELFDGQQSTTELFAEKMCEHGIWIEEEDEHQRAFYSMHRQKERNLHRYLLSPQIQRIYNTEVMELLPLIEKESIEGSDFPTKKGSTSYKVVTPDWHKEIIAAKKQLAQSQSHVRDLQEEIQLADETIATQKKALESKNEQLKMARTANAPSEKTWMKRYKKFFKRTW